MPPIQNQNGPQPGQPVPPPGGLPIQPGAYSGEIPAHQPVTGNNYQAGLNPASFPHRPGSYADATARSTPQPSQPYAQPGVYAPSAPYPVTAVQPQPGTPGPAADATPYSFFLDSQQKAPQTSFGAASSSTPLRLIIALVGLSGLFIGGFMIYSFLFNAPTTTDSLVTIANDQQELVRVTALGSKNVDSAQLQNFSTTAHLSLLSDQQKMISYLGANGTKLEAEKLVASRDPKTDQALQAAESANTYDATYSNIVLASLKGYTSKLRQAYGVSTQPQEKALLEKQFNSAQILVGQLDQTE